MQRLFPILFLSCATLALAAPPEQDRQAILKMAGKFHVDFKFDENLAIAPGYTPLSKPYHEEALEVVEVAEDTPERITLQHLLVVGKGDKTQVIKHWAQVWTWQDTKVLDYAGSNGKEVWLRHEIPAEKAAGQWSQLVTSTDDTPRYESLGKWTHEAGESCWTSEPTRRPLPRREYEHRDDYDYLVVINRHTLTPKGWAHEQDNRKVVDRDGKKVVLAHETGLNVYTQTDDALAVKASDWWKENGAVWDSIRNFWIDAGQQPGPTFSYQTTMEGTTLRRKFGELEKTKPAKEAVIQALTPFLSASN